VSGLLAGAAGTVAPSGIGLQALEYNWTAPPATQSHPANPGSTSPAS